MADQREDLYATRHVGPRPTNVMDVIRIQHAKLTIRGITPTGISLSPDLWLDAQVVAHTHYDSAGNKLIMGLPVTIIGDKNGVIAWGLLL